MPIDVLFIHSAGAQSGEQGSTPFVRQLRRALGPGYRVTCPTMPLPEAPSYARWHRELEKRLAGGRRYPVLVGHSLGGSVLLKHLSEQDGTCAATSLHVVAAPYWGSADWQVDEFQLRDGFARHLPSPLQVHLYQSEDDEVVAIDHLARYAQALPAAKVVKLGQGGHTFPHGLPELARDIQAMRVPPRAHAAAPRAQDAR
jgi:predicted alpha/beta hydrolase family esterase